MCHFLEKETGYFAYKCLWISPKWNTIRFVDICVCFSLFIYLFFVLNKEEATLGFSFNVAANVTSLGKPKGQFFYD